MTSDLRRPADGTPLDEGRPLERQLRWIIGIRLLVVTSVVLPYFLLRITSAAAADGLDFLYVLAGLTYGASLLYIALLRLLKDRPQAQIFIQFLGDLLLITGMVYYFGGVASPFSILYFIVIIVASTLLRRPDIYAVAAVAWLLYAGTVIGVHLNWLPSPTLLGPGTDRHRGSRRRAHCAAATGGYSGGTSRLRPRHPSVRVLHGGVPDLPPGARHLPGRAGAGGSEGRPGGSPTRPPGRHRVDPQRPDHL